MKVTKEYLNECVAIAKAETQMALQTVYDALNQGQQKKLLKNEEVKALLERFDVVIGDGD